VADHPTESIHTLLADAFKDSTDLARKEFALFKAEMGQNMRNLAIGLGMFVGQSNKGREARPTTQPVAVSTVRCPRGKAQRR
jgi:hypothetical protein